MTTASVLPSQDPSGRWTVTVIRECGHTVASPRRLEAQASAERHGWELLGHSCLRCVLGGR